jgi:glycosyltransferase involved in cell wall biosynthesis
MTDESLESTPEPPARRLRVLTLIDGMGVHGGGESLARQITLRLDRDRFEPTFCVTRWDPTASDNPEAIAELESAGVGFIGLDRRGRSLRAWRPLLGAMRRQPFDILHTHKHGSNVWGALFRGVGDVPVFVAHEHTWSFEGRPVRKFLDRHLIGRRADRVVAVSNADRERMIAIEGLDPAKVVMIPNGIPDPVRAPGAGVAVRAELGIEPDVPVIGTVAAIRPQKRLDVLIDAMARLARTHPEVRLLIAGGDLPQDPHLRERLIAQASHLGVADAVTFLGLRDDVPAVIDAFDLAVSSSDFEGSPLSVMEYMDGGLAVVATAVGGVPDLIADGDNGLLVEPRDPAALGAAIGGLLDDPQRRRAMGERGRERRRAEFTIGAMVRRIEALYEELYAAAPSRR